MEFLRRQVLELRAGQIATVPGQIPAGQGQITAGCTPIAAGQDQITAGYAPIMVGQGQITAGQGQFGARYGQIAAGPGQGTAGYGQTAAGTGQGLVGYGRIVAEQNRNPAGQGQITPGQGQITAGSGHGQPGEQGQGAAVHMVETDTMGMLASALDDMSYEEKADNQYEDLFAWDDPKAENSKRAVSDGESNKHRPKSKRPTLKQVVSQRPGVTISEEDLDRSPSALSPADLLPKPKRKRRHPKE